ncbi:MAG TPA: hypothetical protein VJ792_03645 [Candidatus Nitrosotalea sp.]|nr:hypothetical protein [Candidatus Nitrosotalea sp.]
MGVHNNFHAPKDSWPAFAWYAIEFFVVMAVGVMIAINSMDYFHHLGFTSDMTNWIFWGIVGIPYLAYYMIVRPLLFKKPALKI